jgi:hypothetical protein
MGFYLRKPDLRVGWPNGGSLMDTLATAAVAAVEPSPPDSSSAMKSSSRQGHQCRAIVRHYNYFQQHMNARGDQVKIDTNYIKMFIQIDNYKINDKW